jgi:cold shock CspA family protein
MRGTMLWFNLDKDLGVITSDDGTRVGVAGSAFVDGVRPKPRCTGTAVDFHVVHEDGEDSAVDVSFVPEVARARARRRSTRWRG